MTTDPRHLLLLLNWMSPAFPTGAFAYSHGLEWAIESGAVKTGDDVRQWIADLLTRGSGWNDAVIFARCYEDDAGALNDLALALCSSRERFLETTQLGRAFAAAAHTFFPSPPPVWGRGQGEGVSQREKPFNSSRPERPPHPSLSPAEAGERGEIAYPVASGSACRVMGIAKDQALIAFLQGFAAALTSVAVRLVPLGQTAGLEVLRDLMPVITTTAERAAAASLDDLGSTTLLSDIAAMNHESQHSRVFRT
jgi:urease accessory protein